MASVSSKVDRLHKSLMIKLLEMMDPNDQAYKHFIFCLRSYLPEGMLSLVHQNPSDVFLLMEKRGILKAGDYRVLKEALNDSGYINVLDILKNEEEYIARQMRKRSFTDDSMACGSSNIDAATVSSIEPEEPATASSIKPEVETPELSECIRSVQIGNQDAPMSYEEAEQFMQLQIALKAGEDDDNAATSVDAIMQQGSEILKRQVMWHLASLLAKKIASLENQTRFRVWPGTDISTGKIIFACFHQVELGKKMQCFFHIDISYRRIGRRAPLIGIKKEDIQCTMLTEDDISLIQSALEMHGNKLFTQHRNLQAICGRPFLLHENRKEDCVEQKAAVILYCLAKGIKPYGEDPFPTLLSINGKNIPVDIREGYFMQTVGDEYHQSLCMGISIGERGKQEYGTLGPFVNLGKDGCGFITCAHVVGAVGTNVVQPSESEEDLGGEFAEDELDTNICGRVQQSVLTDNFPYREHGNIKYVGVDAALVRLNEQRQITHYRFPDIARDKLLSMGFREDRDFQFNPDYYGCSRKARIMRTKPVFKYGRTTEFTTGNIELYHESVRMFSRIFHYEDINPDPVMTELYGIRGIGFDQFVDEGDSGAGVFIIEHEDDQGPVILRLIGIVLGIILDIIEIKDEEYRIGFCYVMPIEHILSALGIEPHQLRLDIGD